MDNDWDAETKKLSAKSMEVEDSRAYNNADGSKEVPETRSK